MCWLRKKKQETTGEAILFCPRDGRAMDKRVIGDVIIDVCSHCNGIWLDDEEIDKLMIHSHQLGIDKCMQGKKPAARKQAKKKK